MRYLLASLRHSAYQYQIFVAVCLQPVIILRMQIVVDEYDRMVASCSLHIDCDPVPVCLDIRDYVRDYLLAVVEGAVILVALHHIPFVAISPVVVVDNHSPSPKMKESLAALPCSISLAVYIISDMRPQVQASFMDLLSSRLPPVLGCASLSSPRIPSMCLSSSIRIWLCPQLSSPMS